MLILTEVDVIGREVLSWKRSSSNIRYAAATDIIETVDQYFFAVAQQYEQFAIDDVELRDVIVLLYAVGQNDRTVFAHHKLLAWLEDDQLPDYDFGLKFFLLDYRLETDCEIFVLLDEFIGRKGDRLQRELLIG